MANEFYLGRFHAPRSVSYSKESKKNKETTEAEILDRDLRGRKDVLFFWNCEREIPEERSKAADAIHFKGQGMLAVEMLRC